MFNIDNSSGPEKHVSAITHDMALAALRLRALTKGFSIPFKDLPETRKQGVIAQSSVYNASHGNLNLMGANSAAEAVIILDNAAAEYVAHVLAYIQIDLDADEATGKDLGALFDKAKHALANHKPSVVVKKIRGAEDSTKPAEAPDTAADQQGAAA